jgi:hypothetical protein
MDAFTVAISMPRVVFDSTDHLEGSGRPARRPEDVATGRTDGMELPSSYLTYAKFQTERRFLPFQGSKPRE